VGTPSPARRQIARKALQAVGERISAQAHNKGVLAFGVTTTVRVVNAITPTTARTLAANQWQHYGDPLLTAVDRRLDEAINVVESTRRATGFVAQPTIAAPHAASSSAASAAAAAAAGEGMTPVSPIAAADSISSGGDSPHVAVGQQQQLTLHDEQLLYWQHLKVKFVKSQWYSKVDSILLQVSKRRLFSRILFVILFVLAELLAHRVLTSLFPFHCFHRVLFRTVSLLRSVRTWFVPPRPSIRP
jgi:hypothetical protein